MPGDWMPDDWMLDDSMLDDSIRMTLDEIDVKLSSIQPSSIQYPCDHTDFILND